MEPIPPVEQRPLGSQGLVASAQGLGAMGMTAFYKATSPGADEAECMRTFARALELGINFIDTAWIYQSHDGSQTNEELVGKALAKHGREKFVVATKFGFTRSGVDCSPATIRSQLADSLRRLGTEYVDLYYAHRIDPKTAIEDTMACLAQLVGEGKVRFVGLSECTPDELRRAHAVHPVSAVQLEWSLQSRDAEAALVPACRALGVGVVAYSPLGRGLLSRTVTRREDLPAGDWRASQPRFSADSLAAHGAVQAKLDELAAHRGVTAAQMALAWVHARGRDVFPILGCRRVSHLEQNAAAAALQLSADECKALEEAVPEPAAPRYADMSSTFAARLGAQ